MTHQSLYRRFRPRRFSEVRGQDNLVEALRRAVAEDRVGHAYLFSGPRGTGKTTTARILAKALNCPNVVDGEPCAACQSCLDIADGRSFDVIELDAASNNLVENVRDLIGRAAQQTPGRRKVYILDEAHMFSPGAANALLKTLEEPPDHVVFILATTDPQKLPNTIRSRTQHFEARLLTTTELAGLVADVVHEAGLDASAEVQAWAVRSGAGSARDTLSALERALALGAVPDAETDVGVIVDAFTEGNTAGALGAVDTVVQAGRSPAAVGADLMEYLRLVFLTSLDVPTSGVAPDLAERLAGHARSLGPRGATHALEVLGEAMAGINRSAAPRVALEIALVRITQPGSDTSPSALLARIERLEAALANGDGLAAGAGTVTAPAQRQPASRPSASPRSTDPEAGDTASPSGPAEAPAAAAAPSARGGAASAAREVLAARKRGGGSASPSRAPQSRAAAPPAETTQPDTGAAPANNGAAPADTGAAPDAAQPTPAATPSPTGSVDTPASDAGTIDTDRLVAAWQASVVNAPDQKVRARFGPARLVGLQGADVVAVLPNARAMQRAEEFSSTVAAALSTALGAPVGLVLRIGDGDPSTAGTTRPAASDAGSSRHQHADDLGPPPPPDDDMEEIGDIASLEDAGTAPTDDVDRIAEVFPGLEVVEVEDGATP